MKCETAQPAAQSTLRYITKSAKMSPFLQPKPLGSPWIDQEATKRGDPALAMPMFWEIAPAAEM
jgi:hypothetical protein